MEKVLGQAAIDALFNSALGEVSAGVKIPAAQPVAEPYNFSRAGQISNDQLRAIGTVNDLFARNMMHTLGAWLRTDLRVALVSAEQMAYSEFVDRVVERTYISSVRMEPLGAPGLIEVELELASPIVDLLLGGTGEAEQARPLTDIEDLIMVSVVQMIVKELNVAWQPVGLQFMFEKREATSQVSRLMPAGEKTLCVSFEVRMPMARGVINVCLPSVVLNTILRRLIEEHARPKRRSPEMKSRVRELVGETAVGAVLQFPPVRLRAKELATLTPGMVLRLAVPRHQAAELRVGGLALSRARPVRTGEHRGARIESAGRGEEQAATALVN